MVKRLVYIYLFLVGLVSLASGTTSEQLGSLLETGDSLLFKQEPERARIFYDSVANSASASDRLKYTAIYKKGYSYLQEEEAFLALAHFTEIQLDFVPITGSDSVLIFLIEREIEVIDYSVIAPDYKIEGLENFYARNKDSFNKEQKIRVQFLIARAYQLRLEFKTALNAYKEVLLMLVEDPFMYENAYLQVIKISNSLRAYDEAIEVANKVLAENLVYIDKAEIEELLLIAYNGAGRYAEAIELAEFLTINYAHSLKYEKLVQLASILAAIEYQRLGNHIKADSLYHFAEQSFTPKQKLANNFVYLYFMWSIQKASKGDYTEALSLIERGEAIIRNFDVELVQRLQLADRKCRIIRDLGDIEKALSIMDSVYVSIRDDEVMFWDNGNMTSLASFLRTRYYTERVLLEEGEAELSRLVRLEHDFMKVKTITKQTYENIDSEVDQYKFQKRLRYDYENLFLTSNLIYQQVGNSMYLDTLLNWTEQANAMQFKDDLKMWERYIGAGIPEEIKRIEREYRLYLDRLRYLINNSEDENEMQNGLIVKLPYAQFRYDSIRGVIDDSDRNSKEFTSFYTVSGLQSHLSTDEVILKYFITEGRLFIFYIAKDYAELKEISLNHNISQLIQLFRERLSIPVNNVEEYKNVAYELYSYLIKPFDKHLKGKRLFVVPDSELNLIPFETLVSDTLGNTFSNLNYLVLSNPLSEIYTLEQILNTPKEKPNGKLRYIGIAPDYSKYTNTNYSNLPGAIDEVEQIGLFFDGKNLLGSEGTKSAFLSEAKNYDLIHLALHTRINDINSNHSQLLFFNENNPLTLYEILGVHFKAKLLILSGCNTGRGAIKHGEGVVNLARGFFFAGIDNIVLTKWAIADNSSAFLMKDFYKNLSEANSVDLSLQLAKISYIKNADPLKHHPYYWAAYSSVGRPVGIKRGGKVNIVFSLVVSIFLLSGFLLIKKRYWS